MRTPAGRAESGQGRYCWERSSSCLLRKHCERSSKESRGGRLHVPTPRPSAGPVGTPLWWTQLLVVRDSGTRGDHVTLLDSSQGAGLPSPATGRYVVSVLNQL